MLTCARCQQPIPDGMVVEHLDVIGEGDVVKRQMHITCLEEQQKEDGYAGPKQDRAHPPGVHLDHPPQRQRIGGGRGARKDRKGGRFGGGKA